MGSAPQRSSPRERSSVLPSWIAPAAVAAGVCTLYAATLRFEFVYDDFPVIVNNPRLTSVRITDFLPHLLTAFTAGAGQYWRPVFLAWLYLQRVLFGFHPAGWHAGLVVLHAIVTVLVFRLATRLTGDRRTGVIASLLFGFHPALIESVAWAAGAPDPLLAAFFIPAFLFSLDWRERRSFGALAASLGFYALALMAKEPAIVLPAVIAAYCWLIDDAAPGRLRRSLAATIPYLPFAAVSLFTHWLLMRGASYATSPATPLRTVLTWPSLLVFYLRLLVWPAPVSPSYDVYFVTSFGVRQVLLPLLMVLAIAAAISYWSRCLWPDGDRRRRLGLFACAWIALGLLPVFYLKPLPGFDFAHARYLYLACIGFSLFAAIAIRSLPSRGAGVLGLSLCQFTVIMGAVAGLIVANLWQQGYWHDNYTLFSRGVAVAPRNPIALTNLGIEVGKRGRYQEAIELFQRALRHNPLDWNANFSLGYTYLVLGRFAEAEPLLENAVRLHDLNADPDQFAYLAMAAVRNGHAARAEWALGQAVQRAPNVVRYHLALALVFEKQGKTSAATIEYNEVLRLDPGNGEARRRLALLTR